MLKDREQRKAQLHLMLLDTQEPLTGQELSQRLGVTRQVVVHDIALLRAEGIDVISTPRGYLISTPGAGTGRYLLSVSHPPAMTAMELYTLVDYGIRVIDVQVDHPVYGDIRGTLHLASRRDVDLFLHQVETAAAPLLSSLTDGSHMHTVEAPSEERLREAVEALRVQGIQVLD